MASVTFRLSEQAKADLELAASAAGAKSVSAYVKLLVTQDRERREAGGEGNGIDDEGAVDQAELLTLVSVQARTGDVGAMRLLAKLLADPDRPLTGRSATPTETPNDATPQESTIANLAAKRAQRNAG